MTTMGIARRVKCNFATQLPPRGPSTGSCTFWLSYFVPCGCRKFGPSYRNLKTKKNAFPTVSAVFCASYGNLGAHFSGSYGTFVFLASPLLQTSVNPFQHPQFPHSLRPFWPPTAILWAFCPIVWPIFLQPQGSNVAQQAAINEKGRAT